MSGKQVRRLYQEVERRIEREKRAPLKVSIMGQTGSGKSSLLNALFDARLKTDPVRPCTKEVEKVVGMGESGQELWFFDMPGIGEAGDVDETYLAAYGEYLLASDIVLWAIHADNRSVVFDQRALQLLLERYPRDEQVRLVSKITFVLTKADLLSSPPWIFVLEDQSGFYMPAPFTRGVLEQKALYYREAFLCPYKDLLVSVTFNDSHLTTKEQGIDHDDYDVWYPSCMDEAKAAELTSKFPRHEAIFARLRDNHRVVATSATFRFGLAQLMLLILNKLGRRAMGRFSNFMRIDGINQVSLALAKDNCNTVIYDRAKDRIVFDLRQQSLSFRQEERNE